MSCVRTTDDGQRIELRAPELASSVHSLRHDSDFLAHLHATVTSVATELCAFRLRADDSSDPASRRPHALMAAVEDQSRAMREHMDRSLAHLASTMDGSIATRLAATRADTVREVVVETGKGLRETVTATLASDPQTGHVRDAVAGLSTLTNRTAQDVAAARAELSRLNAAADARASAAANSSAKGRDAEAEVEDLLTKSLPACDGWTVTRNNKTSHACDIEVRRTGHPLVRLEIKNKDVVNKLDVEKFRRDLSETTAHGVLVSLRCRVVGRSRAVEFEPQPCGTLAAYVCAQHADGGIDGDSIVSAVRAIHLVHERTVQRDAGKDGAFVAQVELDRLGEEMQGVFKGLKETRSDMEATKRMADKVIARTRTDLETALKRVVAIVLGEKVPDPAQAAATVAEGSCGIAGKTPPSRDDKAKAKRKPDSEKKFQCERCGAGYDQKKRFDTHLATCAMPLKVESEVGEMSSSPSEIVAASRDSDVATGTLPPLPPPPPPDAPNLIDRAAAAPEAARIGA
jgi:hypothetical protein